LNTKTLPKHTRPERSRGCPKAPKQRPEPGSVRFSLFLSYIGHTATPPYNWGMAMRSLVSRTTERHPRDSARGPTNVDTRCGTLPISLHYAVVKARAG
jgi:hypothetical protein